MYREIEFTRGRGIVLTKRDGATQSTKGRTKGKRIEKGNWAGKVWECRVRLLRHPDQSPTAAESRNRQKAGQSFVEVECSTAAEGSAAQGSYSPPHRQRKRKSRRSPTLCTRSHWDNHVAIDLNMCLCSAPTMTTYYH